MLKKINRVLNLFLCHSADWHCVVEAQDEESAATMAVEKVMLTSREENFALSSTIVVKKISNDLIERDENFASVYYYTPMILANGGFHTEANSLHAILTEQKKQIEDE
jgi:hypothetical protein